MTEDQSGADSTSWTQIQQGNVEYVVHRFWQPVYAFLRPRLGDLHEAEEATQEFFLLFLRKKLIERMSPEQGRCRTFIFHVARQFLTDYRRSQRSMNRTTLSRGDAGNVLDQEAASDSDAGEEFDRRWFLALLEQAREAVKQAWLHAGNKTAYRAFKLYYYGGGDRDSWSQGEIAEKLGIPVTKVNNYVHRSRQMYAQSIRSLLRDTCEPENVEEELQTLLALRDRHKLVGPPPSTHLEG